MWHSYWARGNMWSSSNDVTIAPEKSKRVEFNPHTETWAQSDHKKWDNRVKLTSGWEWYLNKVDTGRLVLFLSHPSLSFLIFLLQPWGSNPRLSGLLLFFSHLWAGDWTQGLTHTRQVLFHWPISPASFFYDAKWRNGSAVKGMCFPCWGPDFGSQRLNWTAQNSTSRVFSALFWPLLVLKHRWHTRRQIYT